MIHGAHAGVASGVISLAVGEAGNAAGLSFGQQMLLLLASGVVSLSVAWIAAGTFRRRRRAGATATETTNAYAENAYADARTDLAESRRLNVLLSERVDMLEEIIRVNGLAVPQ